MDARSASAGQAEVEAGGAARAADALRELGRLLEAMGEPVWRARAYEKAAHTLAYLGDDELARRVDDRTLDELPNVGPALAKKIEQLYRSGAIPELDELRRKVPTEFRELVRVPGLGPKKVLALHQALGVDTLDDLERAIEEGRVREVRGFTAAAEERLRAGIATARARPEVHLWLDAVREADRLAPRLQAAGAEASWVAGEPRRASERAESLQVVALASDPVATAARAARLAGWTGAAADGPLARGSAADGLPVEVRFATAAECAAALVFATGPAAHVGALVARAEARGLRLDPTGLYDGPDRVPAESEAALYEALDLAWVPPERRDDPDALAVGAEADHADLVTAEDIVGMVHCHTTFSDGRDTLEDLARACDAQGIAYLTITDHSASATYAGGCDVDALKRQWDEIARVQERVKVRLLRGTESDILADGALDYPDAVLEQLDIVIASVHRRFKLDRAATTERLLRVMRLPLFKVWGHPLGRLVGRRAPVDCDVEAILQVAAAHRVAVEINSDPHRLDLPPEWIARARVRKIPLVISVDAHSVRGLAVLPFGIGIARRAGVTRGEVLNTRPVDAFLAAVRPT